MVEQIDMSAGSTGGGQGLQATTRTTFKYLKDW